MGKLEIFKKDYSKISSFERLGYTYTKAAEDDNYVVWRMEKEEIPHYAVEVWRKYWWKQPDGSRYLHAPSDEEFGSSAWYLVGKEEAVKSQVLEKFGIALK